MGHTLIALIIKAQTDKEARLKAEDVRDVICGTESVWGTIFDWGVIIDGQERLPGASWFTDRWIPKEKTHPLYERLNSSRRILRADSENAQEFIESRYQCTNSAEAEEVDLAGWLKKGYLVRDEKGRYIQENDKRLHDKDYFVVPLDMHHGSLVVIEDMFRKNDFT